MMARVARVCGHSFLASLFGSPPLIIDAGFNHGQFSQAMMTAYDARMVAVEPVQALYDARARDPRLRAWRAAIGGHDGEVVINVYAERCASLLGEVTPGEESSGETVALWTLARLRREAGFDQADLLKLDIEGAELDVFEGAAAAELRCFRQITVEFHDFVWPEQAVRVRRAMALMRAAGFRRINFSRDNTDVLFVRRDLLSWPAWLWLRFVVRNLRGLRRRLRGERD